MAVRFGISLTQKSAVLMYYGIILSERYSIAAGGKAHLVCSFIQDVFPIPVHLIIGQQMVLFYKRVLKSSK